MILGPLELIVLCFPAAQLNDGVRATLDRLDSVGDMRVVDVLVVRTDAAGGACAVELAELPGLRVDPGALARLANGLISETDIDDIADLVDHSTDAVAVLVEHLWVQKLARQVVAVDGTVLAMIHVPAAQGPAGAMHPAEDPIGAGLVHRA